MMKKLYHFHNPHNLTFAEASRRGTWFPERTRVCPECEAPREKRISPLILEWEPGSNVIGDFVWPGFDNEMVVTQKVRNAFEARYSEIEYEPVKFFPNPRIQQPKNSTRQSKPRVWLPYSGPHLWDARPKTWCRLVLGKSNVRITKTCSACGTVFYQFPSTPHRHLVIDSATWNGEHIFRIHENPSLFYCSEDVKNFVESSGFTNVSFLEDGLIP